MNLERIFESVLREARESSMYKVGDIVENDEKRRGTINSKWYDDDMEEYMYSVYYDEEDPEGDDEEELPESMIFNLVERPQKRSSKKPSFKPGDRVRVRAGQYADGLTPEGVVEEFTTRGKNPQKLPFDPKTFWVNYGKTGGISGWEGPDTVEHI